MVSPVIKPLVTIDVPVVQLVTTATAAASTPLVLPTSNVPAVVFEPRGFAPTDFIVPAACAGTWLLGIGEALATGASLPVLLSVGAAAAVSGIAVGLGLARKSKEQVVVSADKKKPLPPAKADEGSTNLRMALETANGGTVRIDNAEKYAESVKIVPGETADRLLASLPRGVNWGRKNPGSMTYLNIIAGLGLTRWGTKGFHACDVNAVITLLSKLGPVTDAQRSTIQKNALDILKRSQDRSGKKNEFQNEIDATARELVARAPATVQAAPAEAQLS